MRVLFGLLLILACGFVLCGCSSDRRAAGSMDHSVEFLPEALAGKSWELVFGDEFEGEMLDGSKWSTYDNPRRDGYWTPDAVELDGRGNLVMRTYEKDGKYYDGCVHTKDTFNHAFGFYTARIKLQKEVGHWSAFWLMYSGGNKIDGSGRDATEIDIMEKPWLDDHVQHTLHWDGYKKGEHDSAGHVPEFAGVMDGYHTFSLLWLPDEYVYYIDGVETWRTSAGGVCQEPLYIKISDEIGKWGGDIKKANLPDAFYVDYVRVYDLK